MRRPRSVSHILFWLLLITTAQSRWDYQSSKLGQTYYLSFSYVYSNSLYIFCGCFSEFWDFCCNTVTHMGWSYTNSIYVFVQYFEDKYPQKIEVVCYKDFRGTKIRFSTTCTKWRFLNYDSGVQLPVINLKCIMQIPTKKCWYRIFSSLWVHDASTMYVQRPHRR